MCVRVCFSSRYLFPGVSLSVSVSLSVQLSVVVCVYIHIC